MVRCSVFTLEFKYLTFGDIDERAGRLSYLWNFPDDLPLHGLIIVGESITFDLTRLYGTFSGSACWQDDAGIRVLSVFTPIPGSDIHA